MISMIFYNILLSTILYSINVLYNIRKLNVVIHVLSAHFWFYYEMKIEKHPNFKRRMKCFITMLNNFFYFFFLFAFFQFIFPFNWCVVHISFFFFFVLLLFHSLHLCRSYSRAKMELLRCTQIIICFFIIIIIYMCRST